MALKKMAYLKYEIKKELKIEHTNGIQLLCCTVVSLSLNLATMSQCCNSL